MLENMNDDIREELEQYGMTEERVNIANECECSREEIIGEEDSG